MKSMSKRMIAAMAMVSAGAMALAGCGGGTAAGDKPTLSSDPVTISIYWWGGDARVRATEEAVQKFEEANPNIKVDTRYADWSGYWDKLNTESAGGNAADVIQMGDMYLASYASQGSLYDLSKVSDYLNLDTMDAALKDTGTYDGTQYAAPIASTPFGVLVNMDLLDQLGLELPDTSSWTWDDFEAFAKQIREKSNGELVANGLMNNAFSLQLWAAQHNAQLFDGNKIIIPEDVLTSYMAMAKDWTTGDQIAGTADFISEAGTATTDQSPFAKKQQVMQFSQLTQATVYAKAAGTENVKLVPLPNDGQNPKYAFVKPSMYWTISSKSEHPAEAAKLIDFLINDQSAGKILGTERGIPANNDIRKSLADSATGLDKAVLEFQDEHADQMGEAPALIPNGASSIDQVIQRHQQNVLFGSETPQEAAKGFVSDLQNEINTAG